MDLCSFLAFGKEFVMWNFEKSGNPVYLHIQQRRKATPEDRPTKKPTLLAVGWYLCKLLASNLLFSVMDDDAYI